MKTKTTQNRLMVLAAGMSSRMRAESEQNIDSKLVSQANSLPKCMIGLGKNNRPFLDYLLYNTVQGGIEEVILLLNLTDNYTQNYYEQNKISGLEILFARQHIPKSRTKPLGTSDAILQVLSQHSDWQESRFMVCNSDNIYPSKVFEILSKEGSNRMVAFDADGYEEVRVRNCAIVQTDEDGFLIDLIEKPTDEEWLHIKTTMPQIGISWNIFGLNAPEVISVLENTPLHPVRQEKELPVSIRMMVQNNPKSMEVVRVSDAIPDLTSKADIAEVQRFLEINFDF